MPCRWSWRWPASWVDWSLLGAIADTRNIFLEAAHFTSIHRAIAGKARKFGMHTDASHRFERGVDAELPPLAIAARDFELLVKHMPAAMPGPLIDAK